MKENIEQKKMKMKMEWEISRVKNKPLPLLSLLNNKLNRYVDEDVVQVCLCVCLMPIDTTMVIIIILYDQCDDYD